MKEKFKLILEYKQLTAAQLADHIGVQRSSFSHILTGRNKPSADFITKLLQFYPEINANWLFGTSENMLLTQRVKDKNLFSDDELNKKEEPKKEKETKSESSEPQIKEEQEPPVADDSEKAGLQHKKVEKVVYFYNDFTFTEYFPG